ncbi:Panacea domain-containing protein [Mycolicibacterium smegmatis]|uniref:Panacea domain-containing protein n=1 Tax=Mycolicibacterium smegmatis TaxID=1772 RepID=UPI001303E999|nr:type II toxin-antitoxin system antitoxin SocA domain-containing protein [Mycolicibacterium smegmatis]
MNFRPVDAARWLIAVAADSGRTLTNFQVQKLLYYAHGDYLDRYGRPLFSEGFQAWAHGPVCPSVYRAFSNFGAEPIVNIPVNRTRLATKISPEALTALEKAWTDYGDWSISELWDDVHRPESPWEKVYSPGEEGTRISDEAIRAYFSNLQSPKLRRSMNKLRKRREERGESRRELVGDAGISSEIDAWSGLRAASTAELLG